MRDLREKVVIVTGATAGIGRATARALAARDARVVAVGRTQAALDALAAEVPGTLPIRADMAQPDDVRAMVDAALANCGRIDVLINNAAQGYEAAVADVEIDAYAYLLRLNVLGPLAAIRAAIPHMRRAGGGHIINVCSPVAKLVLPGVGLYAATKAALRALTLAARAELAHDGIIVSLFYPYITSTTFGERAFRAAGSTSPDFGATMPDPDPPEFTAERLVAAIGGGAKEANARSTWYVLRGMLRKQVTGVRRTPPRRA